MSVQLSITEIAETITLVIKEAIGADASNAAPLALGNATPGVSNDAARADHVHPMPTAVQVGADPAGTGAAAANTAKAEAIAAAATDATTKAGTAKTEAITAAATDATTKAGTAKTEAIAAAASDATTKAGTAKTEAIAAAATDATDKATTAKAEAIAASATDATIKADAAQGAAVQRANHTGTQAISTITGLQDALDNLIALLNSDDTNLDTLQEIVDFIRLNREDLDSLTISSIAGLQTALDALEDGVTANTAAIAAAILTAAADATTKANAAQAAAISTASNDATTKATTAQAAAVQRGNHTGTQSADTLTSGSANKVFTAAEQTKLSGIATGATVTNATTVGSTIAGVTAKTTPVDADSLPITDSAASNALKKLTFANLKVWIKAYLDTGLTLSGLKTFATVPRSTGTATLAEPTELLSLSDVERLLCSPRLLLFKDDFATDTLWNKRMSGSGTSAVAGYATGSTGAVVLSTGSTINSIAGHSAFENANLIPVSHRPWQYFGVFKVASLTNNKVRAGFSNNANISSPNIWAGNFLGFEFNPTASANWRFANGPDGSYTYYDSGVPVVADQWFTFQIRSAAAENAAYWSINGGTEQLLASGAYDYYTGLAHAITNTTAADKILVADYVAFVARTSR